MKLIRYVVLIGYLAGSVAPATGNSGAPAAGLSDDEAAIRKIDVEWSHSAETKDIDGAVAPLCNRWLYASVQCSIGYRNCGDPPSLDCTNVGYLLTFAPTKIVIAASKDMAQEIGTFALKLNDAQGSPLTMLGKYVVTWKKVGGTWKVAADIFNTDKESPHA